MSAIGSSVLERLATVHPRGFRDIDDERHIFTFVSGSAAKTVYTLDAAPFVHIDTIEATIDGTRRALADDEFDVRDTTGNGKPDAVAFVDPDAYPDDGTEFSVSYRVVPIIQRYVSVFDNDIESVGETLDAVIDSHQVNNASGNELDRIGNLFGALGERGGRSDEDYRIYLRSIVQSFSGRGTKPGIKFAIASGLLVDVDDVVITEKFATRSYNIVLDDWSSHRGSTIERLAELSDPSGVTFDGVRYVFDPDETTVDDTASATDASASAQDVGGFADSVDVPKNVVQEVSGFADSVDLSEKAVVQDTGAVADAPATTVTDAGQFRWASSKDPATNDTWSFMQWTELTELSETHTDRGTIDDAVRRDRNLIPATDHTGSTETVTVTANRTTVSDDSGGDDTVAVTANRTTVSDDSGGDDTVGATTTTVVWGADWNTMHWAGAAEH